MRPVFTPRILRKFESLDSSKLYIFPLVDYEWESNQELRIPSVPLIGTDYGFDLLGDNPGLRGFSEERVRFAVHSKCDPADIDSEIDSLRSNMLRAGRGKGWTIDSDGNLRWALMRLTEMPSFSIVSINSQAAQKMLAVVAIFRRQSDWFAEDQISGSGTITTSPDSIVVNNPGNLTAKRVIIRIKSNSSAGFTNPKVVNTANGHEFESETDAASVDDELKLDTSVPSVEVSFDDGVSYVDDFPNYVLPPSTQRILSFNLEPGDNTLVFTSGGTPNFDVEVLADAPYA